MKSFPVMDDITVSNSNNGLLMCVCNPRDMEHSSGQCLFDKTLLEKKNGHLEHQQSMGFPSPGFLSPRDEKFLETNLALEHYMKDSEFVSPHFSSCKKNIIPRVISPKKRLAAIVGPRQSQMDYSYMNGVISGDASETVFPYIKSTHGSVNAYINHCHVGKNYVTEKFPSFLKDVDNENYLSSSIFHQHEMSYHNVDVLENNTEKTFGFSNNPSKILPTITENELPLTSNTLFCFDNVAEDKFECEEKVKTLPRESDVFVEKTDIFPRKGKYLEPCFSHQNILIDNYEIDGDINSFEFGYYLSTQSGKASSQESLSSTQGESSIKLPMPQDSIKNEKQLKKMVNFSKYPPKLQDISHCDQNKSDTASIGIKPQKETSLQINLSTSDRSYMNEAYKESLNLAKKLYIPFTLVVNPHILNFQTIPDVNKTKQLKLIKINTGTFCTVYKAWYQSEMVAVKCPQKNKTLGDATMMRLRSIKEWRILGKLYGHPNVVKLIGGVVMAPSEIWIITEYIEGGDLYSRLNTTNEKLILTPKQRVSILRQLLSAVSTLHSQVPRIVHKDLKINNILILGDNQVRLCDFGDAEEIFPGQQLTAFTAVTWQYASPEIIFSEDPSCPAAGSTEKVDIWSLGCIILELCYQRTPFWNLLCSVHPMEHRKVLQKYLKRSYCGSESSSQCITTNLPPHLKTIVESCLSLNPEERPTALQIVGYLTQHETEIFSEITQLEKTHSKFECDSFHIF